MANIITPGVTPFERKDFVTDERFNLMVAELAAKIATEGGGSELIGDLVNLTTEAKINLVEAINELDSGVEQIAADRGYIDTAYNFQDNPNNMIVNGIYHYNSWGTYSNIPRAQDTGRVYVSNFGTGVTQLAISAADGKMWSRARKEDLTWTAWGEIATTDKFTPTSQLLVVGSGFEAQTGASPFTVTKSGQMIYFIGQLKCLANTTSSPVVLATSPISPVGYFGLNILVNGVRQEGLTIAPGTGQIYIYRPFSANDIIIFNGFAIGDI